MVPGQECYSPKMPYSCINGIGTLTCIFFQRTVEELFLKINFLEHVRALHHYIPCTYAFCTLKNPSMLAKVAKMKKL
jgi:hypothetical protein